MTVRLVFTELMMHVRHWKSFLPARNANGGLSKWDRRTVFVFREQCNADPDNIKGAASRTLDIIIREMFPEGCQE